MLGLMITTIASVALRSCTLTALSIEISINSTLITAKGPRFFDLEKSVLDTDKDISKDDFSRLQQEELEGLENDLCDKEG